MDELFFGVKKKYLDVALLKRRSPVPVRTHRSPRRSVKDSPKSKNYYVQ